jgi:FkbM family methyltransferase
MDNQMRDDGTIQPAKVTHFTEQGFTINGVIHGGANDFEEAYSYKDLGIKNIIGFEPYEKAILKAIADHKNVELYPIALSDKNGTATLNITYGDGKGSSLLAEVPDHPEIKANWTDNANVIGTDEARTMRLDHFIKERKLDFNEFDCLVLDTQGNEMEVLKGCGKFLKNFKYLSVELSSVPVYVGETPGQEVIDWLAKKGFTQDSPLQSHNDVFFVRSDIKPTSDLIYRGLA